MTDYSFTVENTVKNTVETTVEKEVQTTVEMTVESADIYKHKHKQNIYRYLRIL